MAATASMRVLGIDPGTLVTGYGVVEEQGERHFLVQAGTVRTLPDDPLPRRLKAVFEAVSDILKRFEPDSVAIENTFLARSFASALKLGQASGVVLLAAELSRTRVVSYSPSEVKLAVVGYGSADKHQVQRMVGHLLVASASQRAQFLRSHHMADALAVALCHLHASRTQLLMAGADSLCTPEDRLGGTDSTAHQPATE